LDAVRQYLDRIPDDGKRRDVAITLHRVRRTVSQNRLYWLWVNQIADETGNTPDDLHEAFRSMFLGARGVSVGSAEVSVSRSTTTLDTAQFTDFLTRLEAWVTAELSIILPHPEDLYWADFEAKYGSL